MKLLRNFMFLNRYPFSVSRCQHLFFCAFVFYKLSVVRFPLSTPALLIRIQRI